MLCVQSLSPVRLFATPWTRAYQASLSMGFSKQELWRGLPFHLPGDLPDPGIEPVSPLPPALAGRFITTEPPGKPRIFTKHFVNTDEGNEGSFPSFWLPKSTHSFRYMSPLMYSCVCSQVVSCLYSWGSHHSDLGWWDNHINLHMNVDSTSEGSKISASATVSTTW